MEAVASSTSAVSAASVDVEETPADIARREGIVVTFAQSSKKIHRNVRDISVSNLTMLFHGTPLVEDAELTLNYGNRYGFIGRNGSGKSTFMKMIGARCFPMPEGIDSFHLKEEIEATDMTAKEAVMSVDKVRAKLEAEAEELNDLLLDESCDEQEEIMDRLTQEETPADIARREGIVVTFAQSSKKIHRNVRDISVSNLTMLFHGTPLVEDAELTLNYGNRYGFIGRNGSGKSTFMKMIGARCFPMPEGIDSFHLKEEIEATDMTAKEAVMSVDKVRAKLEAEAEELNDLLLDESCDEQEEIMDRLTQVRLLPSLISIPSLFSAGRFSTVYAVENLPVGSVAGQEKQISIVLKYIFSYRSC